MNPYTIGDAERYLRSAGCDVEVLREAIQATLAYRFFLQHYAYTSGDSGLVERIAAAFHERLLTTTRPAQSDAGRD